MRKNRSLLLLGAAGLVSAVHLGCAAGVQARNPSAPLPQTIAVLEFGAQHDPDLSAGLKDGCIAAILDRGLKAVEREQLSAIMQEKTLRRSDEVSPDYLQKLGELVGVDGAIVGRISPLNYKKGVASVRLISTRTGEVLAVSRLRGRLDKAYKVGQHACSELLDVAAGE